MPNLTAPTDASLPADVAAKFSEFLESILSAYFLDVPQSKRQGRRETERIAVTIPLTVTPLDEELRPVGYSCQAITRNVGLNGVGFVADSPIGREHVQLTFKLHDGRTETLIAKVIHLGETGFYFHFGCQFIAIR